MGDRYLVIGSDISVNHSAIVILDHEGNFVDCRYLTNTKKHARPELGGARLYPKTSAHVTKELYEMQRLMWLRDYYAAITSDIVDLAEETESEEVYVVMEGYAFNLAMRGKSGAPIMRGNPYQIGEVGGMYRILVKELEFKLRLHGPTTLKYYVTGRGNATKEEVHEASEDLMRECGIDIDLYPAAGDIRGDICDAFGLACTGVMEVEVRAGRLGLEELDEAKRKIFLRTTKKVPVNLLDRPWT